MKYFKLAILLFLALFTARVGLAQGIEEITNFHSQIVINSDGTVDITENIDYYFHEPHHGIFRTIPLSKTNQDNKKFLMEILGYSVLMDGEEVPFEDNSTRDELNLKIGDANEFISGTHEYEIRYKLAGALTYFSDHDELYWNVTGNDWQVPILRASATVNIPYSEKLDSATDFECFVGALGSEDTLSCEYTDQPDFTQVVDVTKLSGETTRPLNAHEGFTVVVGFPKDIVGVLEPKPDYSDFLPKIGYFLYAVALPGYLIIRALKLRRRLPEEKMVVSAWFDPAKLENGRFLTAAETGTLSDFRTDIRDISGQLIQLAQKGYIKIREDKPEGTIFKKPAFTFIKVKDWESSKLMDFEKDLLDLIFQSSDEVSTKQISKRTGFSSKLNVIMTDIAQQLVDDGLLLGNVLNNRGMWMAVLFFGLFFFNPLLILAALLSMNAVGKTPAGGDAIAKTKSLKNFIVTQDEQYKFQAENQIMFEKLLPYAIAFGVEKVWIERFKDLVKTPPEWYQGTNNAAFNYAILSSSFNDSFRSASQMTTTRSSSGFSSGFSGGFSGGGGGGGGGGSW